MNKNKLYELAIEAVIESHLNTADKIEVLEMLYNERGLHNFINNRAEGNENENPRQS